MPFSVSFRLRFLARKRSCKNISIKLEALDNLSKNNRIMNADILILANDQYFKLFLVMPETLR